MLQKNFGSCSLRGAAWLVSPGFRKINAVMFGVFPDHDEMENGQATDLGCTNGRKYRSNVIVSF